MQEKLINYYYYYFICTFIFSTVFRTSIFSFLGLNGLYYYYVSAFNIFAFIYFVKIIKAERRIKSKLNIKTLICSIIFIIIAIYSNINKVRNNEGLLMLFSSIIPTLGILSIYPPQINWVRILIITTKIYTRFFTIIFLLGIVDYFLGGIFIKILANYFSSPGWKIMIISENSQIYRLCSIVGSPLMNAYFALIYIILNLICKKITGFIFINKTLLYLIGGVTIILTGSRTAFLTFVLFVFFAELSKKISLSKVLLIIVGFIILFQLPIFKNTIGVRFTEGGKNILEDNVRFIFFQRMIDGEYGRYMPLYGGGYNYSRQLTALDDIKSANFEYPFLMFLFDYGIIATLLYYIIFYLLPILFLIKNKEYFMILCYSAIFFTLQTFNIITQFYDFNLQLGFLLVLFLGLSINKSCTNIK